MAQPDTVTLTLLNGSASARISKSSTNPQLRLLFHSALTAPPGRLGRGEKMVERRRFFHSSTSRDQGKRVNTVRVENAPQVAVGDERKATTGSLLRAPFLRYH